MKQTSIGIQDLEVECIIGVWAHERTQPQLITIDVEITIDATDAAKADNVRKTLDYVAVCDGIRFILETGQFELLETACSCVLQWILNRQDTVCGPPAREAKLRITKPAALSGTAMASVQSHASLDDIPPAVDGCIAQAGQVRLTQHLLEPGMSFSPTTGIHCVLIQGQGLESRSEKLKGGRWEREPDDQRVNTFTNNGHETVSILYLA